MELVQIKTYKDAQKVMVSLSNPSKMPGASWSTPAQHCQVGSKLAKVEGSICHGCYALKGMYNFPVDKDALAAREDAYQNEQWVEAMTVAIRIKTKAVKYFRWFDSGDIASVDMLIKIAQIARNLPDVMFWLPTKEYAIVAKYLKTNEKPVNLTIRLSAYMIDQKPPKMMGLPTSTVDQNQPHYGNHCPAPEQGGECKDCRNCWNPEVENVSYHKH
jgi:hypothetical protein